jgi:GNAT superfamily N-acetyltransferase
VVLETVDRPVSITAGPEHDAPLTEMFEVTSVRQLLHVLADAATIPEAEPNTDFLAPHLIERIAIPEDLRAKLRAAFEQSVVTAYFVDDQPVAFCYAAATTETLWDVVIETLPAFRRRGCARACARFMIRYMRDAKKHPVWAIAESSPAALELARKLGFGEIDQMVMFQLNARPDANSPGPPVAVPGTPHEHSPSSFV